MTDVRAGHKEILVTKFRRTSVGAAAVDRAVLADDIVVSDFDFRLSFRRKRNVLRRHTDDPAVSDGVSAADYNVAFDHDVRLHYRFFADRHMRPNDREWADLHIGGEFRIRIDDCRRVNFRVRHVLDFSRYNTPASLKLK